MPQQPTRLGLVGVPDRGHRHHGAPAGHLARVHRRVREQHPLPERIELSQRHRQQLQRHNHGALRVPDVAVAELEGRGRASRWRLAQWPGPGRGSVRPPSWLSWPSARSSGLRSAPVLLGVGAFPVWSSPHSAKGEPVGTPVADLAPGLVLRAPRAAPDDVLGLGLSHPRNVAREGDVLRAPKRRRERRRDERAGVVTRVRVLDVRSRRNRGLHARERRGRAGRVRTGPGPRAGVLRPGTGVVRDPRS